MSPQPVKTTLRNAHTDEEIRGDTESQAYREQVALLAYQLWQQRGSPVGSPEVDWLEAEQQLEHTLK